MVVGGGCGLVAAITAATFGGSISVVLLEKNALFTPDSVIAGGNTAVGREADAADGSVSGNGLLTACVPGRIIGTHVGTSLRA